MTHHYLLEWLKFKTLTPNTSKDAEHHSWLVGMKNCTITLTELNTLIQNETHLPHIPTTVLTG